MTHQPGQRFGALKAIRAALDLPLPAGHSRDELRNEAIAALCLPDLEVDKEWNGYPTGSSSFAIDPAFERYALADKDGNVTIGRLADDAVICRLPGKGRCADYNGLVFSPDGRFLRVGSTVLKQQAVWRLDVDPPRETTKFAYVDFSPDSKRLAAWDSTGMIRILDIDSLAELRRFDGVLARAEALAWNPADPRQILLSSGRAYRIVNVETGEMNPLVSMPSGAYWPVWHPEGRMLAFSGVGNKLQLWDPQRRVHVLPPLEGHRTSGIMHSFSHSGDMLVSSDWSALWRLWDTHTGQQLLSLPASGYTIQFSHHDNRLAAHTGAGKVRLFRVASGKEFRTLVARDGAKGSGYVDVNDLSLHKSGRLLAVGHQTYNGQYGTALVDIVREEELAVLGVSGESPVGFEASGDALLTFGENGLHRWPIHFLTDSTQVKAGPPVQVQNLPGGRLAQSADGSVVAVATRAGASIWLAKENRHLSVAGAQSDVRFCAVSPDGRWVATGSGDLLQGAGAKIWNATTGKLAAQLPLGGFCGVWFSPDGKWLLTGSGGYRLWAVGSWQEGPSLGLGPDFGEACAFTQDGRLLALSDAPGVVRLCEPDSGREIARLTANVNTRLAPKCFTADGNKLIALGTDTRTLHIFDLKLIRAGLRDLGLYWESSVNDTSKTAAAAERPAPLTVHVDNGKPSTARRQATLAQLAVWTLQSNITPFHPEPYHQRAHVHEALGEHQKAIDDFSDALRWQMVGRKRQAHLYEARAMNYRILGRETDAAADLGKALGLDPHNPVLCNNLGQIYVNGPMELRAPGKALALAETALRLAPDNWICRNTLGVAHYRLGHFEQAVVALERSLRESKNERAAFQLYFLAMCYSRLGDVAQGRECYDQALNWVPEHPERLPPDWRERLQRIRAEADSVLRGKVRQ